MNRPRERRAGRALTGAALAAAAAWCLAAGCAPPAPYLDPARNRLPLDAWVSVAQDSTGAVSPGVRVSAPYRSLVFHREGDAYRARLEVAVVARRDGVQCGGGVAAADVAVPTYAETRGSRELVVTAPLLIRGEQPVALDVTVSAGGAARRWLRRLSVSPGSFRLMPVWIVDVAPSAPSVDEGYRELAADADSLVLAVSVVRRRDAAVWPRGGLAVVAQREPDESGVRARRRTAIPDTLDAGTTAIVPVVWATSDLPFGRCRLQVALELSAAGGPVILPREPDLEIVNLHVPVADDHAWRRHVAWLDRWLAPDVRDSLRTLAPAHRPQAWRSIWLSIGDGDADAAASAGRAHLLRIVAADDRFGGFGRGSLSDRGRVFIRWGEPDRVETYADARTPGAEWEIWVYPGLDRRFVFHDAHGMGDFVLRREEPLD